MDEEYLKQREYERAYLKAKWAKRMQRMKEATERYKNHYYKRKRPIALKKLAFEIEQLTAKEQRVIDLILLGFLPLDAAKLAGYKLEYKRLKNCVERLLLSTRALNYMKEKLQTILEKKGLTEEWVLDRLKAEAESLENKGSDRLSAVKMVAEFNEMFNKEERRDDDVGAWEEITSVELNAIEDRKKQLPEA